MTSAKQKTDLLALIKNRKLAPYIEHIRFPQYKNLSPDTRIDFTYPITALVGTNGTNKSSILRAIWGAPDSNNLGNFWFSTSIDPIKETGGRPSCFIYGVWDEVSNKVVEILKTRVSDKVDADYWEPSRPIAIYGMEKMPPLVEDEPIPANRSKTRWKAIEKNVVFLDFRAALSAFDKFFYHGELTSKANTEKNKKEFIRTRAPHLKRALDYGLKSLDYRKSERLHGGINRKLNADELSAVSAILGRTYSEIKIIRHSLFNCDAYSCFMTTTGIKYTEAFAGSGEFAVVRIVTSIFAAEDNSLILLDEPEVSLHPGAQDRLLDFLTNSVKKHKHQIVISTHSPTIVRKLPPEAIKVLALNPTSSKVQVLRQSALPEEAFFHLGEPLSGRVSVIVEDVLAQAVAKRSLAGEGEAVANMFQFQHFPGGSQTLWAHYLPIYAAENRKDVLVLLDGDQRPEVNFSYPDSVAVTDEDQLQDEIIKITKADIKFHADGGKTGVNTLQQQKMRRQFISWALSHVDYLPSSGNPEEFILTNALQANTLPCSEISNAKLRFEALTRLELGVPEFEQITSEEILATQRRLLATIPVNHPGLVALKSRLLAFAQSLNTN